jgi:hypothetical protein
MDYSIPMMMAPYMSYRAPPMLAPFYLYKPSRVPPSSYSLSYSLLFFNTKLYIIKYNTSLDLTFLRSSALYLSVNRFIKIYSSVFYIDLRLVLMMEHYIFHQPNLHCLHGLKYNTLPYNDIVMINERYTIIKPQTISYSLMCLTQVLTIWHIRSMFLVTVE